MRVCASAARSPWGRVGGLDRREFRRPVAAAAHRHQPGLGRHHVARPQRRIVGELDMRQAEGGAAVAGATGDELLAVAIGVGQVGVAAAVAGGRVIDVAAGIEAGLARRAERMARLDRAHAGMRRDREIMPVAGAHAETARRAGALARDDAFLLRRRRIERAGQAGERIGEGLGIARRLAAVRKGVAQAAEQLVEKSGRRRSGRKRRRRDDHAHGRHQRHEFTTGRHRSLSPAPGCTYAEPGIQRAGRAKVRTRPRERDLSAQAVKVALAAGFQVRNSATRHRRGRWRPRPPSSGTHRACR